MRDPSLIPNGMTTPGGWIWIIVLKVVITLIGHYYWNRNQVVLSSEFLRRIPLFFFPSLSLVSSLYGWGWMGMDGGEGCGAVVRAQGKSLLRPGLGKKKARIEHRRNVSSF